VVLVNVGWLRSLASPATLGTGQALDRRERD
jgi:hypothetical protein